jgi:hypothetical protein
MIRYRRVGVSASAKLELTDASLRAASLPHPLDVSMPHLRLSNKGRVCSRHDPARKGVRATEAGPKLEWRTRIP